MCENSQTFTRRYFTRKVKQKRKVKNLQKNVQFEKKSSKCARKRIINSQEKNHTFTRKKYSFKKVTNVQKQSNIYEKILVNLQEKRKVKNL